MEWWVWMLCCTPFILAILLGMLVGWSENRMLNRYYADRMNDRAYIHGDKK